MPKKSRKVGVTKAAANNQRVPHEDCFCRGATGGLRRSRGSSVEARRVIESTAQSLQAKQELLTTDLQISDLTIELDDAVGLPLTTKLELEPNIPGVEGTCEREECKKVALESHPEILAARSELRKASAAVRLSKADYYPELTAFARYSYQDQVPFLVRNFGSFGAVLTYDLFDGGRRSAALHESEARLAQARENLARVTDDVELRVDVAYNKRERTRELINVSEALLALRTESSRVFAQQPQQGAALRSQAKTPSLRNSMLRPSCSNHSSTAFKHTTS